MRHFVTVGGLATALMLAAGPSPAQTIIGGTSEPSVQVNLGVLDSLAPDGGSTSDLYGTALQQPEASSTGSVQLIAPSGSAGTTLTDPAAAATGSVLLLNEPATTPTASASEFVFPEVPETKPAVPVGASVTTGTQDDGLTTTTTVVTTVTAEPEPEPEPVAIMAVPEDEIMGPPQEATLSEVVDTEIVVPASEILVPEPEVVPAVLLPETEVAVTTAETTAAGIADAGDDPFQQIDSMLNEPVTPEEIVVPEPEMEMETTEVVTVPPSEVVSNDNLDLQILFDPGVDSMTDADQVLLEQLAERLSASPDQRIQLRAYASSDDGTASAARRLALARALQVRAFLIENSVRSTRIDVRALGDKVEGSGPLDRIDIVLVEP